MEIGRVSAGHSGVVWKARDTGLDRLVALKQIMVESSDEASALASMSSEHVVQVFGVVEDAGRTYLVEEWIEGATLAQILHAHGPLSPGQALSVSRGALSGLADVQPSIRPGAKKTPRSISHLLGTRSPETTPR